MLQSTKLAVAGIAGLVGGLCLDRQIIACKGNNPTKDIRLHIGDTETPGNGPKSLAKVPTVILILILTYKSIRKLYWSILFALKFWHLIILGK